MNKEKFLSMLPAMLGIAVLTLIGFGCGKPSGSEPVAGAPAPPVVASNATAAAPPAAKPSAGLQKLKGRWLRPDGGYILEIKQVDANGQLEAAYFNPNPIRVTSSSAKMDGEDIKVFIELTDVNYPGCKYDLKYISAAELMVGTYFQAAINQTFDVVFERAR